MGQDGVALKTPEGPVRRARARWLLLALGLFITVLNSFKPLTLDDSVYYLFAVHIADHPLDPYGFRAWQMQPANSILAPPVFLYWWALAVRVFGQEPVFWKLALLPFNLLLVFTLHALGRRFARGLELPFVCFVTLSGTFLPCANLMLDIPALALALLAVVLFLRACDGDSLATAVAAGVVAGMAMQTKYTAFIAPGVMVLYGFLSGRWRLGLLASSLAGLLFVGWELVVAFCYGDSHFWLACTYNRGAASPKLKLVGPLFGFLGSTIAAGLPFALAALGRSARVVWAITGLVVLVFVLVALPLGLACDGLHNSLHLYPPSKFIGVLFGLIGLSLVMALGVIAYRLVRQPLAIDGLPAARRFFSVDGFLGLWLLLEIAGYFALSPYPATRRVLGIVVLGTLLICRLAARTTGLRTQRIWGIVGINFLLGLLLFAVDFNWYHGHQVMAQALARECQEQVATANIWYFGNGTFEFYGERVGMKRPMAPEAAVSSGDWVLVVDGFESVFSQHPISSRCVVQGVREWSSILPVRSQYQYGNVALERQEEPLRRVTVYRIW